MCSRMDKQKAVVPVAYRPARLICTMPTKGQEHYEERYRQRVLR